MLTILRGSGHDKRYGKITEGKMDRWYGADVVETLKMAASGCYIQIPVAGAPIACFRGDFVRRERAPIEERARRLMRRLPHERGGFASLSDLISEATTGGKSQQFPFNQIGTTAIVGGGIHTWGVGPVPAAGAAAAAPPGGTVPDRSSAGAVGQANPSGGDTQHLVTLTGGMTVAGAIMLYDKLAAATTAANPGTGSVAITAAQTRYTGSSGTPEYPAGCVISNRITVALPATAHNLTYGYTDQDNNAGASSGAFAGRASAAVNQIDFAAGSWCAPLASGDTGVRQLTSVTFSASPATGQVEHFVMRPLAIIPCPLANTMYLVDGINSAFNLMKIMDGAALTFLQFPCSATTATSLFGTIQTVSG